MKLLYSDDFGRGVSKKSLSAISNREMLNGGTQKERQFEYVDDGRHGLYENDEDPLKNWSLDTLVDSINSKKEDSTGRNRSGVHTCKQGRIHNKGQQARYKLLQGDS